MTSPIVTTIRPFTAPCGGSDYYDRRNWCWPGVLPKSWSIKNLRESSKPLSLSSFCIGAWLRVHGMQLYILSYITEIHADVIQQQSLK